MTVQGHPGDVATPSKIHSEKVNEAKAGVALMGGTALTIQRLPILSW